ncbi:PEP-CTERM sorting domain-containing protein [bacterium]|nr:PEP-CTERM sorting domain-containing protein [bacterium]
MRRILIQIVLSVLLVFGISNITSTMPVTISNPELEAKAANPVPESGTIFLLGIGLIGLAGFIKKF